MLTTEHLLLIFFSLSLGFTAKYADLVNEHGLPPFFKGSKILSGWAWGLSGIGVIIISPFAGLTYIAHVLYWFLKIKLDFANHALAGVLMLLGGFYFQGDLITEYRNDLVGLFIAYTVTGYIQNYCKNKFPSTRSFWRLRLRIYLIPIVYAVMRQNWDPIIATGCGMMACEWMTYVFRAYKNDVLSTPSNSAIS